MKYLTIQNIVIVAVTIAVVGFLSTHQPGVSLIANVMSGQIWLTDACRRPLSGAGPFSDLELLRQYQDCTVFIAYRWVLALDVVATAVALIIRGRISN